MQIKRSLLVTSNSLIETYFFHTTPYFLIFNLLKLYINTRIFIIITNIIQQQYFINK